MTNFSTMANALRMLSVDAVEAAASGHPGMPLGMADIATVLWSKHLQHNPDNPQWFNRDRFVLSNGHGSMLLYALLHLTGYKLSIDDLKNFRQLHSKTPGHPEYKHTPGVEVTTGPLAQGLASAVGMAIAERALAAQFNQPSLELVNHYTYVFAGDGCLMEGLSHEACSLAGTLELNKLIVFYDDNGISIDGEVKSWFTDDTALRFKAYHWQVIGPIDGHDEKAIDAAILEAKAHPSAPSLIICKTTIGFASPLAGNAKSHGAPLGTEGVLAVRKALNWPHPAFIIPDDLKMAWNHKAEGLQAEQQWLDLCLQYKQQDFTGYEAFLRRINNDLPDNWPSLVQTFLDEQIQSKKPLATRQCSQACLEYFAAQLPELLGGSADLTGSNNTNWSKTKALTAKDFSGNYLNYGVREFAMAAIMNGLAVHGGFIPYGGTFLVFSDYARSAIRLSAIMSIRVIYVLTHDSIGLGEDGPTHQPIEHAAMLRMTPNLQVWRPADMYETAVAWSEALKRHHGPTALLLSRQTLEPLAHTSKQTVEKGGYIVEDPAGTPEAIFIATGSEVQLALKAARIANASGRRVRVVSMPCCELFLEQPLAYQEAILPPAIRQRIAIEAAATAYWYRFVGLEGKVIGLDQFGLSAPAAQVYDELGITVEKVLAALDSGEVS